MNTLKKIALIAVSACFIPVGCNNDDDDDDIIPPNNNNNENEMLNIAIEGLDNLGPDYAYQGWLVVDGSPVSAGVFTVNDGGDLSQTTFDVDDSDLNSATAYIVTIEPSPDTDPEPTNVKILAGDFSGNDATLSVGHESAIGTDFSDMAGSYILATPTNGDDSNENSGVWWLNPGILATPSLELPDLPLGWKYEGWAVIDGTPVSTGKFLVADEEDDSNTYSGAEQAPAFPGEDFLFNSPSGLNFPTNLADESIVVSVEPDPDNSPMPFVMKPLIATVPLPAEDHNSYQMANNAADTNPSGEASR